MNVVIYEGKTYKLTHIEIEIFQYLPFEYNIEEIASKLELTPDMVKYYMDVLMEKFKTNDREKLIKICLQNSYGRDSRNKIPKYRRSPVINQEVPNN